MGKFFGKFVNYNVHIFSYLLPFSYNVDNCKSFQSLLAPRKFQIHYEIQTRE